LSGKGCLGSDKKEGTLAKSVPSEVGHGRRHTIHRLSDPDLDSVALSFCAARYKSRDELRDPKSKELHVLRIDSRHDCRFQK